ncbi:MAG: sensor domain-containing diguanylate cyclase [Lachnospiraceae bacterium]|nr:sensor domain-containing diguanylate cyclase [Lachnospiraceae bacterium]
MNNGLKKVSTAKIVIGSMIAFFVAAFMLTSNMRVERMRKKTADFGQGWRLESGEEVYIDKATTNKYGSWIVLSKNLPKQLALGEDLCFASYNSNFDAYIGDELVYSYHTEENLTGKGYGVAYHYISMAPAYAGKKVTFYMTPVIESGKGGRIGVMTLESFRAYQKRFSHANRTAYQLSNAMIIIGFLLLLMCGFVPLGQNKKAAVTLAVSTMINGFWLSNDTGMWRLLFGEVLFCRLVDHIFLHIWIVPMLLLAYYITKERNRLYPKLIFAAAAADIAIFLILRYAFGCDMANLTPILMIYYAVEAAIGCAMLVNNRRFCDRLNAETGTKLLVAGFITIAGCLLVDSAIYMGGIRNGAGRGRFSRVGLIAFFVMITITLVRNWTKERETMKQDRFINKMLQYSIVTNDPDLSVRSMMEYVGTEFGADHVYIYENRHDGTFHNTYEWFRDEHILVPGLPDYSDLSDERVIGEVSKILAKEHRLLIPDVEQLKDNDPVLYDLLKSLNVRRMVVGPLEYGGELIGLFGVDDMPADRCGALGDSIWLISYFVTQLLVQRNEKRNLVRYSFFDTLTGIRNRRGLEEFENTSGRVYPYGYLMCDINGLKTENDTHGHEAGDMLITDVAKALTDVFGDTNVFRIGGDEFVAYSFVPTEEEFETKVKRVRGIFEEKKRSASIGYVFARDPSVSREEIKEQADALMYTEKERYYSGRRDRRR